MKDNKEKQLIIEAKEKRLIKEAKEKRLIKEAKAKGFEMGVTFFSAMSMAEFKACSDYFSYCGHDNGLFLDGGCVYINGEWAMIKDEEEKEDKIEIHLKSGKTIELSREIGSRLIQLLKKNEEPALKKTWVADDDSTICIRIEEIECVL